MILAGTGGRDYHLTPEDKEAIASFLGQLRPTVVRHGGCRGFDKEFGVLAEEMNFFVDVFRADRKTDGWAAGPRRNRRMLLTSPRVDVLLVAPGGSGTANCRGIAERLGTEIVTLDEIR